MQIRFMKWLFVAELTRQLKDFNEPCILVMYGDHLPSLGIGETDMNKEISSQQNIFCGVISRWKRDKNVEAYQFGAYVMQRMGINGELCSVSHQKYLEQNANEVHI